MNNREKLLLKVQGWVDANPGLTETKDQELIRLSQGLTPANLIAVNYTVISLQSHTVWLRVNTSAKFLLD